MSNPKNINLLVYATLVIAAIASRFIPHPFNFTAVGAAALFSGAIMKDKRYAYLIPVAILFLTDVIIGLHFSMIPVYGCFALTVWIGTKIGNHPRWSYIIGASLISSILFFLITNLPFWYIDLHLYPMTLEGTLSSYNMALPFFRNQLVGDLFFNGVLFGIYFLITSNKRLTPIILKK
jgi:hypothetical protein